MTRFRTLAPALLLAVSIAPAAAAPPPLPHLHDLAARFGARPDGNSVALSPSGDAVVVVVPLSGTRSVAIVRDLATGNITPVAGDKGSEFRLRGCAWKTEQRLICTLSANSHFEGQLIGFGRVVAVDRDGKHARAIGRRPGDDDSDLVQSSGEVIDMLPDDPAHVLMDVDVPLSDSRQGRGVVLVDVATGNSRPFEPPREEVRGFVSDAHGHIRAMELAERDASGVWKHAARLMVRAAERGPWTQLAAFDLASKAAPKMLGFDADATHALVLKPRDGRRALYRMAVDGTGREEPMFASDKVDVDGVLTIGKYSRPVAAKYTLDAREYAFFDPRLDKLSKALGKALDGKLGVTILDESWDGGKILVFASADDDPGAFFRYDAATHRLDTLFDMRPGMAGIKLAQVKPVRYAAADGTQIPAFLTLPPGHADMKGLPAIVMPHGGPAARDARGFDWLPQFFAASGYAVLQPNFRGSAGYGDQWFVQNGFKSWKIAMGDIDDGARWLATQGADAGRMAIVGWSYGGYAALQANVLDPKLYKAAIAIAPVTDLALLKAEALGFTNSRIERDFIGSGPHIAEGSPARNADRIEAPVLIFQGTADLNVDQAQAHRMDAALAHAGKAHSLVIYPDLDHQLDDSDARADMLRRSAAFLAEHLGGAAKAGTGTGAAGR